MKRPFDDISGAASSVAANGTNNSKPVFLTKAQREQLALQRGQEVVSGQKRRVEQLLQNKSSDNRSSFDPMYHRSSRDRDRDRYHERDRDRDREHDRDKGREHDRDRGFHNHRMIVYGEGHRQSSELTPPMKEKIREMAANYVKPGKILHGIRKEFPESQVSIKQVYNVKHKIKEQDRDGRNSVQEFAHLAQERNYTIFMDSYDETDALTHVFAAHSDSVRLLQTYPHLICVNCTYKTNKYKYPLCEVVGVTPTNNNFLIAIALIRDETEGSYWWVLSRVRDLIGSMDPYAILTNRGLGMLKPISMIFPNSAHLLCTWHIKKVVLNKVFHLYGKDQNAARAFIRIAWVPVICAASEREYDLAVEKMQNLYGYRPAILEYVTNTWLVHKEKFVQCWTNRVRHFGNTTMSRVESQHFVTKEWLENGRGKFDTLFERVDGSINNQLIKIRCELENSICKIPTVRSKALFQNLLCNVSLHCLMLLMVEKSEMELMRNPENECRCVKRFTHGIPCACRIWVALQTKVPFGLDCVDPFWRTLVIGESAPDFREIFPDNDAREREELIELAGIIARDGSPQQVRNALRYLRNLVHPKDMDFKEPEIRTHVKGRPKGSTSTCRDPSAFEYMDPGQGRGRGRSSSQSTSGRSSMSSVNMEDAPGVWDRDFSKFPYRNVVMPWMFNYLDAWSSPALDGNCGFRCVAASFLGGEDNWPVVRFLMEAEIKDKPSLYQKVYAGESLEHVLERIHWTAGKCDEEHWMTVHADLYAIANIYKCAIFFYGREWGVNVTILPLYLEGPVDQPLKELCMMNTGNHFIRLRFSEDFRENFPVPRITRMWTEEHHGNISHLADKYGIRVNDFENLCNNM